ncbi:hypothetical protein OJ997_15195 [Solirubrobacter phytolaccae]|uniref:Uncharacterized protein n=1 Tax=Solirubrobacter phytolaccae TaxID=1404360 RepID=A0A9X3NB27_9ACTN|nr:hypothetical protein [Solirubrobacter phytolaccae]MDA0181650.1 hypothetical protein [Solirubrobacter phytolaccae]
MQQLIRIVERRPLIAVAALVVVVLLVGLGPRLVSFGDDGHALRENSLELIPAAIALTYMDMAGAGDRSGACSALTDEAADASRCDTPNPRPRRCGSATPEDVRVGRFTPPFATIHAGDCTFKLEEQGSGDWRVAEITDR